MNATCAHRKHATIAMKAASPVKKSGAMSPSHENPSAARVAARSRGSGCGPRGVSAKKAAARTGMSSHWERLDRPALLAPIATRFTTDRSPYAVNAPRAVVVIRSPYLTAATSRGPA